MKGCMHHTYLPIHIQNMKRQTKYQRNSIFSSEMEEHRRMDPSKLKKLETEEKNKTMSTQKQTETLVSLKLVIDKKGKKILHAEADKTFINFLFNILSLPVETVVRLLSTGQGSSMVGSLGSLYRSLEALNITYFKQKLLKPNLPTPITQSQILSLLKTESSSEPKTYYTCSYSTYYRNSLNSHYTFSGTYNTKCPKCNNTMYEPATYVHEASEVRPIVRDFLKGQTVTYMVMDDLTVKPLPSSSVSIFSIFDELNVENVGQIGEELIRLNVQDGLNLLRASLHSSTVLTDLFLSKINFSQYSETKRKRVCEEQKLKKKDRSFKSLKKKRSGSARD